MSKEEDVLNLNVNLEGKIRERFLEIKKAKGLKNNSEAVRFVINEFYAQNVKEA